ncbi:MAG: DsbA family protein, partial [Hyphomicrobiaceae bacterium]|nr:DsbA family protein [Hyphomicrobiaceae bacterium]
MVGNGFPRAIRSAALAAASLAACVAISGCSGSGPTLTTGATVSSAGVKAGGDGLAVPLTPEEIAAQGSTVPPNPFADITTTAVGGREVIANPTLADVLEPATPYLPEMSFGKPDAPVVLVKYMSLTCPYCRQFHAEVYPKLKSEYIDTGKVRFVLREFPIGRTSGQATVALRCAAPEKYLDLYGRYLNQQA